LIFPTAGVKDFETLPRYWDYILGTLSQDQVQEATHDMTAHFERCDAFNARGNIREEMWGYCMEVGLKYKLNTYKEVNSVTLMRTYQIKTRTISCRRKKRINM
jgi:hypothetical protein